MHYAILKSIIYYLSIFTAISFSPDQNKTSLISLFHYFIHTPIRFITFEPRDDVHGYLTSRLISRLIDVCSILSLILVIMYMVLFLRCHTLKYA